MSKLYAFTDEFAPMYKELGRLDSASARMDDMEAREVFSEFVCERSESAINEAIKAATGREDAAGNVATFSRELEVVSDKLLRTKFGRLVARNMFSLKVVGAGVRKYTVRRSDFSGEAEWIRGNSDGTFVNISGVEESFNIDTAGLGMRLSLQDIASDPLRTIKAEETSMRAVLSGLERKVERVAWEGDDELGKYGVLNYPWLHNQSSTQVFSEATAAASPDALLAVLNTAADFPSNNSDDAFGPNHVFISARVFNLLKNARYSSGSTTDTTMWQRFMSTHPEIKGHTVVPRLRGVRGSASIDAIFFARLGESKPDGTGLPEGEGLQLLVGQEPTWLPVQRSGYGLIHLAMVDIGGLVMEDVGNNILLTVPVA